jgi:anti-sigma-K factor RskA
MMKENHVDELIPAYALGSLEEDELLLVSRHLSVCQQCQTELEAYQEVVDLLPLAAPDAEPDPSVKERLMARVRAAEATRLESPPRPGTWDRLRQSLSRSAPAWALVSLVLVLFLGVSNVFLWQRVSSLQASSVSAAMRTINMSGTSAAPGATGLIVVSLDGEHGTLVVDHLPTLGEDRQYQLWLIEDGQRDSGGVFSVSKDGYGSVWVSSPQPLADYSAFGVTIEPAGGSPGPTGEKVLGGEA